MTVQSHDAREEHAYDAEPQVSIHSYYYTVLKRRWIVLAVALTTWLVTAILTFVQTPLYKSTALIQVDGTRINLVQDVMIDDGRASSADLYATQEKILRSRALARQVVEKLELWKLPLFHGSMDPSDTEGRARLVKTAVGKLLATMMAVHIRRTHLIEVSFLTPDPELSARLTNTMSQQYIRFNVAEESGLARNTSTFILEQVEELRSQIREKEKFLRDYSRKQEIVMGESTDRNIVFQRLQELNRKLTQSEAERAAAEVRFRSMQNVDPLTIPEVRNAASLRGLIQTHDHLAEELARASTRFKSDWPEIQRLEGSLEQARARLDDGVLQMGLFDERNLFEVTHPDFPNERLVACRNPELAERWRHKRRALLEATCKELEKVCRMVERRRLQGKEDIRAAVKKLLNKYKVGRYYRLDIRDDGFDFELDETTMDADASRLANGNSELANKRLQRWKRHMGTIAKQFEGIRQRIGRGQLHGKDKIGVRVGRVLNKYKVGKHFKLDIRDDSFSFEIDDTKVTAEAALDGIYVIRTSLAEQRMKTDDTVRSYKLLTQVERAFRSFKSMDLKVRPIRHRRENRVRAHVFLCMLAYYVLWHMMEAWRPLLFSDEDQQAKARRDPVAPAKRSEAALRKIQTKKLDDGSRASSFRTLLRLLSNIVRNKCRRPEAGPDEPTFDVTTTPDSKQQRAYDLLKGITV